ncbi:MAG: RnfABCDGE type electron transport complex subunit D [Candidatus Caldatribacteriaceae bacterium]
MSELIITPAPHLRSSLDVPQVMTRVFVSLLPAAIWGVAFFGWRLTLVPLVLAVLGAVGFEALDCLIFRKPLSIFDGSALVTGLLLGLSLPPGVPLWIPLLGSGVAIVVGKQMFGGLGQNIFNPALVGRAVLFISWPSIMASFRVREIWALGIPLSGSGWDTVTTATPLGISKLQGYGTLLRLEPRILWRLFVGTVPGCIGEISAVALLAGFFYLLFTGIVRWDIPTFYFLGLTLVALFAGQNPLYHILAGGAILGGCFMATDYVTSPLTFRGKVVFGLGAGMLTGLIRWLGGYPEGVTFGILVMNAVVPFLDRMLPRRFGVKKV